MSKSTRSQNTIVLAIGFAIVAISVVVTLYVSGRFANLGPFARAPGGYQNYTFTDAVLRCQTATRSEFGTQMRSMEVDDHSSRYDAREFVYKIFLKVETPSGNSQGVAMNYVNCFVSASSGKIGKFESYLEKEDNSSPVTGRETNVFGWPK